MHAVIVLPRFYPYRGGYENSMLAIARSLAARGHRATVFTTTADDLESLWLPGYKSFDAGQFVLDRVTVRRFPVCYRRWRRRATRIAGLLPYWRWKAQFWRPGFRVPGLKEALRELDADVFHIGPLPYNNLMYAGLHAAENRRAAVIATPCLHMGQDDNSEVWESYAQPQQIRMLQQCDLVVCMTTWERKRLAAVGVSPEKLRVTPHGADLKRCVGGDAQGLRLKYDINGPVVLHLGMKAFDKGSMTVFQSMKRLWEKGSPAWLLMAGPSVSEFDQFLKTQGHYSPRLLSLGAFSDEEKPDLFAVADIVVQPSRVESLGLVAVEAWANSKPVILADIEVSRGLVQESGAGEVVPFGDVDRLAQTIERLLDDPETRHSMGMRGQAFAGQYDSESLWRKAVEAFEEVAQKTSRILKERVV